MIVIGIDPAVGGGFGRVVCDLGDKLVILDAQATYNLPGTEEQIALIGEWVKKYRPSQVIIEIDAQQKALGNDDRLKALATLWGFQIRPHVTRGTKLDTVFGVASMDQSFAKGDIRIPYGDQQTMDRMSPLVDQLRRWRPDEKRANGIVKKPGGVDDLVMALWFVHRYWMQIRKVHETQIVPAYRPSWLIDENAYRGTRLTA